jgi:hypothetical protein
MQLTVLYLRRSRYAPYCNYNHYLGFCKTYRHLHSAIV